MNSNDFAEIPICMCGWRGCTEAYQGNQPPGWVTLIAYHAPQPVLDLTKIKDWQHDRVLCPTHAAMLSAQLYSAGGDQTETPDST
jgi:hypothetical protein